jgi:hypothetical protein
MLLKHYKMDQLMYQKTPGTRQSTMVDCKENDKVPGQRKGLIK